MTEMPPESTPKPQTMQNPFGSSQHQKSVQDQQFISLSRQVSDFLSRLRLLEERYANLRREHQTTEQNMIENHQNLSKQQRKLSEQAVTLKRTLKELQEQIGNMQGELADVAKSHDLKVIERYLALWNPMSFITKDKAEELIKEALENPRKFYKQESAEKEEDESAITHKSS